MNIATVVRRMTWLMGLVAVLFAVAPAARAEPNFQGVWQVKGSTVTLLPAGKTPPFTPAGLDLYKQHQAALAKGDHSFDLTYRCSSPGTPRIMLLPYPFQILQQPDLVVMTFEWNQLFRQIVLSDKRDPYTLPSAIGFSAGRWDQDTLVVTTTDRNGQTLLDSTGLPHSDKLKLTERFRLKNGGKVLEDRMTIEDPDLYAQPWEAVAEFDRLTHTTIQENVCLDRVAAGRPPIETPAERRKASQRR